MPLYGMTRVDSRGLGFFFGESLAIQAILGGVLERPEVPFLMGFVRILLCLGVRFAILDSAGSRDLERVAWRPFFWETMR